MKQLFDYEEGQEMFAASDSSGSIVGSFVANDLAESMKSLLTHSTDALAVYSEDCEVPQEELEGEDLQFALKGDPIPGTLGDENY